MNLPEIRVLMEEWQGLRVMAQWWYEHGRDTMPSEEAGRAMRQSLAARDKALSLRRKIAARIEGLAAEEETPRSLLELLAHLRPHGDEDKAIAIWPTAQAEMMQWHNSESRTRGVGDNEYTILRALRDSHPRRLLMSDLAANVGMNRKACGDICAQLAARSLVDYSANSRQGAAISESGRNLLAALDAKRVP